MSLSDEVNIEGLVEAKQVSQELLVVWYLRKIRDYPLSKIGLTLACKFILGAKFYAFV